jgi:hypothetical protein
MYNQGFGSNGLRLGCVISQNNRTFLEALRTNSCVDQKSSLSPSGLKNYLQSFRIRIISRQPYYRITANILDYNKFVDACIRTNRTRLADNYEHTARFLKSNGLPCHLGGNAGLFVWIDFR